jgi:hypothetical protein
MVKYTYPETLDALHKKLSPRMKEYAIEYAKLTDTDDPRTIEMMEHDPCKIRDRLSILEFEMGSMLRKLDTRARVEALDITLDELSESDEFLKRAMEADAATRLTELEHGFKFYRNEPDGEIIFGPLCTGTMCALKFDEETAKCPKFSNTFHTHPTIAFQKRSMWSDIDFLSVAASSNLAHAPRIGCVKSIDSDTIWCEKMQVADDNLMEKLISLKTTPLSDSEFDTRQQVYDEMYTLAKSSATSIPVTDEEPRPVFKPTGYKGHPYLGGPPLRY